MTLSQKDRKTLSEHWDEAKAQLAQRFPGVQPDQLGDEPDASAIADATGQPRTQVESALSEVAQQYTSGT